jgi:hypothetical protein
MALTILYNKESLAHVIARNGIIVFTLDDCFACKRLMNILMHMAPLIQTLDIGVFEFRELNPADISLMRELRVRATPQIRKYSDGNVIDGLQGISEEWSDEEIANFLLAWFETPLKT